MREALREHASVVAAVLVLLLVGASVAWAMGPPPAPPHALLPFGGEPIELPLPWQDADGDTYADWGDLTSGDRILWLNLTWREPPAGGYLLVGTQDDHGRTGAGRELAWPHIVDPDPLGRDPGSRGWLDDVVRTGHWQVVRQEEPSDAWAVAVPLNVREDNATLHVDLEARDSAGRPDPVLGEWAVTFNLETGRWHWGEADTARQVPAGEVQELGIGLAATVEPALRLATDVRTEVAQRWAPTLRFDEGEALFPTRGESLHRFHGFADREPDLRTWTRSFNNGRDGYNLVVADFNGDRDVDHEDVALLTDVLRAGDPEADTVYAEVAWARDGRIVVQYWFLYHYNFVSDQRGRDVEALAHSGDREFIQLTFEDLEAARSGEAPLTVSYSQHYGGVRIPGTTAAPDVYVARGSHASYPAPGDDRRLRTGLAGFGDVFGGGGETWTPDDYTLELLGNQTWHAGYLWGPLTRHSRDLGTSFQPLLQHGFRYPFQDPLTWQAALPERDLERLAELYGGPS
ncbi:MAG: hypothetical protein ACPGQL_06615 [Thermoplasmatota archaeon]